MPHMRKIISPARYNYSRTSIIRTAIIRNVDYPNGNHTKRRLSERQSYETSNNHTHIFFAKIFSAFLKKNTVYSETVTKPAETARQTAKSLLKEAEILQAAWWYNA